MLYLSVVSNGMMVAMFVSSVLYLIVYTHFYRKTILYHLCMSAASIFNVIKAWELDAERDLLIAMPTEGNNKQAFYHTDIVICFFEDNISALWVPVRSSNLHGPDGRIARVQMVAGQTHIVQTTQGLRRILIEFPQAYCPGIKVYQQESCEGGGGTGAANNTERASNVVLPFALFDPVLFLQTRSVF